MKKLIVKLIIAAVLVVGFVGVSNLGVKDSAVMDIMRSPGGNGGIGDN